VAVEQEGILGLEVLEELVFRAQDVTAIMELAAAAVAAAAEEQ
jgi:hypothetical protein